MMIVSTRHSNKMYQQAQDNNHPSQTYRTRHGRVTKGFGRWDSGPSLFYTAKICEFITILRSLHISRVTNKNKS